MLKFSSFSLLGSACSFQVQSLNSTTHLVRVLKVCIQNSDVSVCMKTTVLTVQTFVLKSNKTQRTKTIEAESELMDHLEN